MRVSSRVSAVLRRIGLLVSGLAVVALSLAVVGAASLRGAEPTVTIESTPLTVGAGTTTWVCAPTPTLPTAAAGQDIDYDDELGTGAGQMTTAAELTAVSSDDRPSMSVGPIGEDRSDATGVGDLATFSQSDVTTPLVGVVEPAGSGVPLVGGVSVARADTGDLRGLVASTCQRPVSSAYLVAGSTELGSSARLVLSNPGDTAATVTLTAWGATGPRPDPPTVVVPAGGVRAVLLETISLEPRIAVRVDAEGGRVVPTLQTSALDGLVAAGTDIVGPTADPSTELIVPGVDVSDAAGASATLRLLNPGDTEATVTVEMLGPEGAAELEGAVGSVVEPGTVVDISLAGVTAGTYSVRVTSDEPVAGGVRMTRTGQAGEDDPDTPPVDIAWMPSSVPVDRGVVPIPGQLIDTVSITATNPGQDEAQVTATSYDAHGVLLAQTKTPLAPGATAALAAPDGAMVVVLEGTQFVAAAVVAAVAADGTTFSGYPIVPDPHTEQQVTARIDS